MSVAMATDFPQGFFGNTVYNISMKNVDVFKLLASYTEEVFHLKFTLAETEDAITAFSREHYFHPLQTWLTPQALQLILVQTNHAYLSRFKDALHLQLIFFYYEGTPVLVGPFLTEPASRTFATALKHRYPDRNISVEELLIYFGKYPVIPEEILNRLVPALCSKLGLENLENHVVSYTGTDSSHTDDPETSVRVAGEALEHHYREESLFMDAIERGNTQEALRHLRKTETDARVLWASAPIHTYRAGAAVSRAMARTAAYRAGVPAPLIHRITSQSARRISMAETSGAIQKEKENVVQELCLAVSRMRSGKYSALVQTVLYALDTGYGQDIREQNLAHELGVTESYMIAVFRRETGQTPGRYLLEIRLKNAARMLFSSGESIRAIAGQCGIPDSNYFARLFRARYGCTPREYRKRYCI